MLGSEVFERFVEDSPVCVMARATLENMFAADVVNDLFQRHSQQQYERELLFSSVVDVMSLVVAGVHPSVHAAYQRRREGVGVSVKSLYNKLNGIEPEVSRAVVRHTADTASALVSRWQPRPPCLKGYRTKVIDGNHLSGTDHRLEVLREEGGAALPGLAAGWPGLERTRETPVRQSGHRLHACLTSGTMCDGATADFRRARTMDYRDRLHRPKAYNDPGHAHELTCSCYRRFPFLSKERTCQWLAAEIRAACQELKYGLWAYVFMPEHVHLIVHPREKEYDDSEFLKRIKEPVARQAVQFLKSEAPVWLNRIRVPRGRKVEHHFWQPGRGHDRNIEKARTLLNMIDYIHENPVRRGLVEHAGEWKWSSAGWFAGVPLNDLEPDRIPWDWLEDLPA